MNKITPDLHLVDVEQAEIPSALYQTIGFNPHEGQLDLRTKIKFPRTSEDDPRFYVANASRRFGKTWLAASLLIEGVLEEPHPIFGPPTVGLLADTYEHSNKVWDKFTSYLFNTDLKYLVDTYNRERELITFKVRKGQTRGATVQKFSAIHPESLTGDGYTLYLIDEAQFVSDEAMNQVYPAFTDRGAVVIAFGVCQNDGNWFNIWEERGDDPDYPEYIHLQYPWFRNPFLNQRFIDLASRDITEEDFRRLYLVERPSAGGAYFGNIDNCLFDFTSDSRGRFNPFVFERPLEGQQYVGGLDVAKVNDFSVLTIFNRETGREVYFHRLTNEPYSVQAQRFGEAVKRYKARVLVDITGVGAAVIEQLRDTLNQMYQDEFEKTGRVPEQRGSYEGQIFTNAEKVSMAANLKLRMEKERIRFANIPERTREIRKYQAKASAAGRMITGAPAGGHDDTVSSLMLVSKLLPTVRSSIITTPSRHVGSWEKIRKVA